MRNEENKATTRKHQIPEEDAERSPAVMNQRQREVREIHRIPNTKIQRITQSKEQRSQVPEDLSESRSSAARSKHDKNRTEREKI